MAFSMTPIGGSLQFAKITLHFPRLQGEQVRSRLRPPPLLGFFYAVRA